MSQCLSRQSVVVFRLPGAFSQRLVRRCGPGRHSMRLLAVVAMLLSALAVGDEDTQSMSEQLEALEREQQALKAKIDKLEHDRAGPPAAASEPAASSKTVTAGTQFNPQISAVLDGNYYNDGVQGVGTDLLREVLCAACGQQGHSQNNEGHGDEGHSHGGAQQGFNIREAELYLSANVDPYFEATAVFSVAQEGIETEEAYFATRSLPAGLKLKAGKFFSGIGYVNSQHPHQWDFVDQNLAYQNMFDFNLQDIGVQLSWLPALPMYTLFGVEIAQGDQQRFGATVDDSLEREELGLSDKSGGPTLFTGFFKIAPNLGYDNALQLGAWVAHNSRHQTIQEADGVGEFGLEGDATIFGLDLVYKYDAPRSYGAGDFVLQAEYLYDMKNTEITGVENDQRLVGSDVDVATDGFYLQGRYGLLPRWQLALRYDVMGMTNTVSGALAESFGSSQRGSLALSWTPSEFSLFRLQFSHADILETAEGDRSSFNYVYLQYLISIGSHGAHRF
jgi:hypothetical protein